MKLLALALVSALCVGTAASRPCDAQVIKGELLKQREVLPEKVLFTSADGGDYQVWFYFQAYSPVTGIGSPFMVYRWTDEMGLQEDILTYPDPVNGGNWGWFQSGKFSQSRVVYIRLAPGESLSIAGGGASAPEGDYWNFFWTIAPLPEPGAPIRRPFP